MMYFDAHNHLQDPRLDLVRSRVIDETRDAGVAGMVVNGTHPGDWPRVDELASRYPDWIVPAYGVHPWYVEAVSSNWSRQLEAHLAQPGACVGEIGLDRWKKGLPWDGQAALFTRQLEIAAEHQCPVTIHCLQAWGPLYDLLRAGPCLPAGFLLHSYGGSVEMARRFADLGAYFSFSGAFMREQKMRTREVFQQLPCARILVETDAPDQPLPGAYRNRVLEDAEGHALNHPAYLPAIYTSCAALQGWSDTAFQKQMRTNYFALFFPDNSNKEKGNA